LVRVALLIQQVVILCLPLLLLQLAVVEALAQLLEAVDAAVAVDEMLPQAVLAQQGKVTLAVQEAVAVAMMVKVLAVVVVELALLEALRMAVVAAMAETVLQLCLLVHLFNTAAVAVVDHI
jgi:hypothetical protein